MGRAARRPGRVLVVVLAVLATGCSTSGLQFRVDDRVEITTPSYREKVELPLTIDWEVHGFEVSGPSEQARAGAGYFAVLIDAEPPPPGESLAYYGRDDTSCQPEAGCPDEAYLAARGVYTTTQTEFHLERLVPVPGVDLGASDRHEVTIILLDGQGRRIGESVWTQPFEVVRGG